MSGFVNKAVLIGNLGRNPEIRSKQDGSKVATFNIATSESWNDKQSGERIERTEWHKIVVFNDRLCELTEKFLTKGSKVYVEGQLKTRKWTDKDGIDRYVTEIHLGAFNGILTFLDSKRDGENRASSHQAAARREPASAGAGGGDERSARAGKWDAAAGGSTGADLDDEVPFGPCWQ